MYIEYQNCVCQLKQKYTSSRMGKQLKRVHGGITKAKTKLFLFNFKNNSPY